MRVTDVSCPSARTFRTFSPFPAAGRDVDIPSAPIAPPRREDEWIAVIHKTVHSHPVRLPESTLKMSSSLGNSRSRRTFVEQRGQTRAKPSVKQELAAVRMLFDWLVVGQVVATNPAHSVRGPKHVVKRGKTPVLTREETRELLDSIESDTIRGLRDRALIGVLVYSFARIGAALAMTIDDYFSEG